MLNIIYVPLELHISPTVQCAVHFDKLITFIFHCLDVCGYWCDGSWASGQWARDISANNLMPYAVSVLWCIGVLYQCLYYITLL